MRAVQKAHRMRDNAAGREEYEEVVLTLPGCCDVLNSKAHANHYTVPIKHGESYETIPNRVGI